jgi:dihydroneopterin aldolase
MGWIHLHRLQFYACHGALPHERVRPRPFWVDVRWQLSLGPAAASDQLPDTVDYGQVAEAVRLVMTGESVQLLETLAARIAAKVRAVDSRIERVHVVVTKAHPPLMVPSGGVSVEWSDD